MSLAQGINTPTRPRIEPGSPDPESDALSTRPVRPPKIHSDYQLDLLINGTSQNYYLHARTQYGSQIRKQWSNRQFLREHLSFDIMINNTITLLTNIYISIGYVLLKKKKMSQISACGPTHLPVHHVYLSLKNFRILEFYT